MGWSPLCPSPHESPPMPQQRSAMRAFSPRTDAKRLALWMLAIAELAISTPGRSAIIRAANEASSFLAPFARARMVSLAARTCSALRCLRIAAIWAVVGDLGIATIAASPSSVASHCQIEWVWVIKEGSVPSDTLPCRSSNSGRFSTGSDRVCMVHRRGYPGRPLGLRSAW